MPKYIIKEGMLDKFIDSIVDSVKKKKLNRFMKDIEKKDPVLAKKAKDLADAYTDLENFIKKGEKK